MNTGKHETNRPSGLAVVTLTGRPLRRPPCRRRNCPSHWPKRCSGRRSWNRSVPRRGFKTSTRIWRNPSDFVSCAGKETRRRLLIEPARNLLRPQHGEPLETGPIPPLIREPTAVSPRMKAGCFSPERLGFPPARVRNAWIPPTVLIRGAVAAYVTCRAGVSFFFFVRTEARPSPFPRGPPLRGPRWEVFPKAARPSPFRTRKKMLARHNPGAGYPG